MPVQINCKPNVRQRKMKQAIFEQRLARLRKNAPNHLRRTFVERLWAFLFGK